MKKLEELVGVESCWLEVNQLIEQATNKVEVLPRDKAFADMAMVELQEAGGGG
ncbi:MAG: hypothetical protein LBG19_10380 [Prevotellaceae bacterium]|jgi:hypothetical protein|nr:hypothetical protein [Prevotellaceae bacterium]